MDRLAEPVGKMGRPAVFSDVAIQRCLSVMVLFKLPLRQAVGMVRALLKLAGLDWPVPDCTTLCRRQKTLAVQIPHHRADGPLNLLVDSTGIRFLGDGEWPIAGKTIPRIVFWPGSCESTAPRADVNGARSIWPWILGMDTTTSDIRAVEFTSRREGDSPTLPALLDRIPDGGQIGSVTADGACDTRRCHTARLDRQAKAIIPIRKTGRLWRVDCPAALDIVLGPMADNVSPRNAILREVREEGRAGWKRQNGDHARSRAEAKMPSQVRSNLWR